MAHPNANYMRAYNALRYAEDWDRSLHAGVLADILEAVTEDPEFDAADHIAYIFGGHGNDTATEAEADK